MAHSFSRSTTKLGKYASTGMLLAALALCAGCGRSRTYTDAEGQTTTVTQKGKSAEVTFKGKDGQETRIGQGVALPDDFPKDVAIYPKANVFASTKEKKGTMSVVLEIADPAPQVLAFYKEKLKENGWSIKNEMNVAGTVMVEGAKEGRKLTLTAGGDSGKTMATLVLEKKAE